MRLNVEMLEQETEPTKKRHVSGETLCQLRVVIPTKERHSSGGWNPFIKRWTPAFAGVTLFWLGDPVLAGVTLFWLGRHYWGWVERLRQGANPYRHSSKRNVIPAEAGIHLQKDGPQPSLG